MALLHVHRHVRLDSPIHRLSAGLKLAIALLLVAGTMLLPPSRPILLILPATVLIIAAALSRIPWRFLLGRVILLEPFVLCTAMLALFQPGGWRLFLLVVVKCSLCIFAMVLLSHTTPFSELLRVLRVARVPELLVTTISLMYRYLFVLVDETQRMKRARMSRTFTRKHAHIWRTLATVVGQLFVRTGERGQRIYSAMCARGWR